MIVSMNGNMIGKETGWVIVEVGGIGFHVSIPLSTYYKLPSTGETVSLMTEMIVREDSISLFGFLSTEEKRMFQLLLSVTKIGPRLALNILSGISARDLASAIQEENILVIKAVPGVGLKTAERIILELKAKVHSEAVFSVSGMPSLTGSRKAVVDDVLAALISLGYRRPEAERAVRKAVSEDGSAEMEQLVKTSLKILSKVDK